MKKNLLALSIAAMVGGIAGGANAQAVSTTTGIISSSSFDSVYPGATPTDRANYANGVASANLTGQNQLYPAATSFNVGALGAASVAGATTGHALIVPYFTTQGDNATLLNLVNSDAVNGKAVKLRFRGASNSDDIFDITIYLSPGDVWAANVAVDPATGLSRLDFANDTSCTLPKIADIKELGGKFKTNRVRGDAKETREGYIEILNTADIPPFTGVGVNGALNGNHSALYTAIKHVNGKAPCTDAVMDEQANDLVDVFNDRNSPLRRGYSYPTGGLFANWTIVNLADKASLTGEAVALRATGAAVPGTVGFRANLVWFPQTTADVAVPVAAARTSDPLLSTGVITPASYDFPDLSTPYTAATAAAQADQLSAALATRSIANEYLTNTAVNFATDWVFSLPTRRYATAYNYSAVAPNSPRVLRNGVGNDYFNAANVSVNGAKNQLCVASGQLRAWDREEMTRTDFVISPDTAIRFCGETSVLSFNSDTSKVLNAQLTQSSIQTKFADGWFRIQTPGVGFGLPVIGFAAAKTQGANLGGAWVHRTNGL